MQYNIVDIGSEMPDRGIQQPEIILNAALFKLGSGGGVELCALTAMAKVDLIDIPHQIQCLLLADILVQGAAKIVRDVVFAV